MPPDAIPLIALDRISKTYVGGGGTTGVLRDVSFNIYPREFVSIMGPSGSGKSTLLNILGFLDHASSGTYRFGGHDVTRFSKDQMALLRAMKIGFVFQSFNLLPHLTVLENVALPMIYNDALPMRERRSRALRCTEVVGLRHRADHPAMLLSGGEKQRAAIARSIINNPDIIFADEPTGNLDSVAGRQVLALFHELHNAGRTIVLITHETYTAQHAQRVIEVRDGTVTSDRPVEHRLSGSELFLK
ncbi:MAG: ABC transporter ATP-binding protein [Candidatus Peribacteraceae bacterium]|jgi:putative ABC transport system ATP-binding protein